MSYLLCTLNGMPFEMETGPEAAGRIQYLNRSPAARLGVSSALKPCDRNIVKILNLVEDMITLADQGDADREDVGCGVLYGVLRDAAYKLKKLAEEEKRSHQEKGWWLQESDSRSEATHQGGRRRPYK